MARAKDRAAVLKGTGQQLFPAIQFEEGGWYRQESKEMARTVMEGRLFETPTSVTPPERMQ